MRKRQLAAYVIIGVVRAGGHEISGGDNRLHGGESGARSGIEQGPQNSFLRGRAQASQTHRAGFKKGSAEAVYSLVEDGIINMESGDIVALLRLKLQGWFGGKPVTRLRGNEHAHVLGCGRDNLCQQH